MTSTIGRLLVAQVALLGTRGLVRIMGFRRTVRALSALPRRGSPADRPDPRWAREIDRVAGPPLGGSCLDRSLLLWFLCRQHHLDATLRIGVMREDEEIVGHAWLEYDGAVLNDRPDFVAGFASFDEDPVDLVFR